MTEHGTDILRYGDDAMYQSQAMKRDGKGQIRPQVTLLSATPDPLGAIAAGMRMFRGDPVYDISEISDEDRRWAWEESIKGHLKAPWEFVDFMFMIEGVTRAFTHQLVRQRTAVYAQESLRFAVKEGLADEVPKPPSIIGNENAETFWNQAISGMEKAYNALISLGIPAEDARGLLPHAVTTRVIYKTNLRGLLEHAGNRLCTQAQFEWRSVFMGFMKAIKEYDAPSYLEVDAPGGLADPSWQFELIAQHRPETFAPVCYQVGHCTFMSELDRGCTIRDRVIAFAEAGIPPAEWGDDRFYHGDVPEEDITIRPISPEEWAANPGAGITDNEHNPRPE
jgi:flavin-dependent thymidylate synthase